MWIRDQRLHEPLAPRAEQVAFIVVALQRSCQLGQFNFTFSDRGRLQWTCNHFTHCKPDRSAIDKAGGRDAPLRFAATRRSISLVAEQEQLGGF
jgi:hypothetical protein